MCSHRSWSHKGGFAPVLGGLGLVFSYLGLVPKQVALVGTDACWPQIRILDLDVDSGVTVVSDDACWPSLVQDSEQY